MTDLISEGELLTTCPLKGKGDSDVPFSSALCLHSIGLALPINTLSTFEMCQLTYLECGIPFLLTFSQKNNKLLTLKEYEWKVKYTYHTLNTSNL